MCLVSVLNCSQHFLRDFITMTNYGANETVYKATDDDDRGFDREMSTEKNPCDVNDITSKAIGDFGHWQARVSILMALLKLPMAWYQLNIIFMAPPQDFWCEKPAMLTRFTVEEWRKISVPHIEEYPCLIFDPDLLAIAPAIDRRRIPLVECKKFVFNKTVFHRTITSDWNLVCSQHWLIHVTQCMMMCGVLLGGIIFGVAADKYGRRKPLMVSIILQSIASYGVSMYPNYWGFLLLWFVLALCSGGMGIISFVVCMEAVGGKWRTTIPILYQLPFGFGNSIMAVLAYYLQDWRKLEFALASLSSLYILYWFWIPESPRWLLATGKTDKAIEVLRKAAKQNHRDGCLDDTINLMQKCKGRTKGTSIAFTSFFKLKHMRNKTILLSTNWFCTGLEFFAFSQYLGMIGGNIFLTVAISGIIYVPGGIVCLFVVAKMGRRATVWIFQIVTAFCFVLICVTPKDVYTEDWPRLLFAGIGFGGLSGSVAALYLYSGELYPTLGRNAGVGGVTTFARIAAMVAPGVVSLDSILPDLPMMLLAGISFAQLFLLLPLPETKDLPLPDTLEEAEQFTRSAQLHRRPAMQ